jgi:hypothetical protein
VAFLRPGHLCQRRRGQPGSRLAAGHRRSRRAAVLTQASTDRRRHRGRRSQGGHCAENPGSVHCGDNANQVRDSFNA